MAHSPESWQKAKFLFETGISLSDIKKDTGIDGSSVSKKAKEKQWQKGKNQELKAQVIEVEQENSRAIEKKSKVVEKIKKANLEDYEITLFDEAVRKELKHDSLIFDTTTLALIRNNQILTKNKKTVMMKTGEYLDGKKVGDTYEPFEVDLSPSDVKEIVESTDKASVTLKVNDRHAPKVQIDTGDKETNNYLTVNEVSKAVAEALPD